MSFQNKPLSVFLLVAWISSIFLLFPLPTSQIAQLSDSGIDKGEIWLTWVFHAGIFVFGVAACIFAILAFRYWRTLVAISSILFCINWGLAYLKYSGDVSPVDLYVMTIKGAFGSQHLAAASYVLYTELVLPLFHVVVVAVLIVSSLRVARRAEGSV